MVEPHEEYKRPGATADERVAAIEQIASALDPTDAEHFELQATRLVELRDDTVKFAGAGGLLMCSTISESWGRASAMSISL